MDEVNVVKRQILNVFTCFYFIHASYYLAVITSCANINMCTTIPIDQYKKFEFVLQ